MGCGKSPRSRRARAPGGRLLRATVMLAARPASRGSPARGRRGRNRADLVLSPLAHGSARLRLIDELVGPLLASLTAAAPSLSRPQEAAARAVDAPSRPREKSRVCASCGERVGAVRLPFRTARQLREWQRLHAQLATLHASERSVRPDCLALSTRCYSLVQGCAESPSSHDGVARCVCGSASQQLLDFPRKSCADYDLPGVVRSSSRTTSGRVSPRGFRRARALAGDVFGGSRNRIGSSSRGAVPRVIALRDRLRSRRIAELPCNAQRSSVEFHRGHTRPDLLSYEGYCDYADQMRV